MGWWSAQRVECGICQAKCWGPGCTGSPIASRWHRGRWLARDVLRGHVPRLRRTRARVGFRCGVQAERPVYPVNVSSVIFLAAARAWSRCDLTTAVVRGRPRLKEDSLIWQYLSIRKLLVIRAAHPGLVLNVPSEEISPCAVSRSSYMSTSPQYARLAVSA
jgi:hypothetical protein